MEEYTIYCTEEQTKRALELGAPIKMFLDGMDNPTAEQMIGFILESGRGYSTDLSELIREQGYKQGCLTFIDSCLK